MDFVHPQYHSNPTQIQSRKDSRGKFMALSPNSRTCLAARPLLAMALHQYLIPSHLLSDRESL